MNQPIPFNHLPGHDLLVCMFLVSVAVLAWNRLRGLEYISGAFSSVISIQRMRQNIRNGLTLSNRHYLSLGLIILMLLGAVIFKYAHMLNQTKLSPAVLSLVASGIVILVFGLRVLLMQLAGWIFRSQHLAYEHIYITAMHALSLGILFIPISWLILFAPFPYKKHLAVLFFVFYLLIYSWKIIRLIWQMTQTDLKLLHIILYLCTLEILPLVVMSKYFYLKFGSLIQV